jgi:hypothetical protein
MAESLKVLAARALVEANFEQDEDHFFRIFFNLLQKLPESVFINNPLNTLQFVLYHLDPELKLCCHCRPPSTEPLSLVRLAFMSSIEQVVLDFKRKINPPAKLCLPRELHALHHQTFIKQLCFSPNLYTYMEEFWRFYYSSRFFEQ